MKNNLYRVACATVLALLCPMAAYSQSVATKAHRAWEFGLGGSATNITRTTVTNFHQTAGGDYVFTLDEKLIYGGVEVYSAMELKKWLYADIQANIGLARYYDQAAVSKQGYSLQAGPGLQFRPFVGSEWIQPYVRVGVNCFHKSFPTSYFGQFTGDVTKEALWKAEDAWNKGYTFDADTFFPVSTGIGIIGWLGNRVGVRIQGQYFHSFGTDGINFAQATAGILLRLGGSDKSKSVADRYVNRHPNDYAGLFPEKVVEKETVREVPVEVIKEVVKEIPLEKTLAEMMDNVNFDFDKATITADSQFVNQTIKAWIASMDTQERNRLVDALFGLLGTGGIDKALDIFHPRNIRTYIKTLGNDPETRQILSAEFQNLMEAAKRTRMQPGDAKTLPEGK